MFHSISQITGRQYVTAIGLLTSTLIVTQLLLILWGWSADASVSVFGVGSAVSLAVASFTQHALPVQPSPQDKTHTAGSGE